MEHIRVLVVDDRPIFRAGARGMLSEYPHINVVGVAVNGLEAVKMSHSLRPDVILMDISMPEMDGVSATQAILQDGHEVAILGLSVSENEDDVASMLEAGACGYILKDTGPEDLARAIEDAHAGRFPLDRSIAGKMVRRLAAARPQRELTTVEALAPREKAVLRLVLDGLPNKAIAGNLRISESTVKSSLRGIYRKLEVDSRAAAAALGAHMDLRLAPEDQHPT